MNCAGSFAVLRWPGAVPISRKCEACDGKGSKTLNPSTRTCISSDGLIVGTMLFGTIVLCTRCNGGHITRYGTRGKSFTPTVCGRRRRRRRRGLASYLGLA
jgi:hypothetical protein